MPINLVIEHVTCDQEADPPRRVRAVHGRTRQLHWTHTQTQVITHIEANQFDYFVLRENLAVPVVVDRSVTGEKYIKAKTDGDVAATLLAMRRLPSALPGRAGA